MLLENTALVTIIENNTDNMNTKILGIQRKYFDESLKCFRSWNKYMPEVKKYAICPTKATLNKREIDQLKELGVEYIEEYMPELEKFKIGFLNVPLSMKWAENNIPEKIFIHTDLDMELLRRIPNNVFDPIFDNKIICGQYDNESVKFQRKLNDSWDLPFDTGFTIHIKNNKFYHYFWDIVVDVERNKLPEGIRYYDIEEYAMDLIHNELNDFEIHGIQKYQLGEGYPSVDYFTDEELKNVYFWHEHLINNKKEELVKERIKYLKRIKNA